MRYLQMACVKKQPSNGPMSQAAVLLPTLWRHGAC